MMIITPIRTDSRVPRERSIGLSMAARPRHAKAVGLARSEELLPTLVTGAVFTFVLAIVLGVL